MYEGAWGILRLSCKVHFAQTIICMLLLSLLLSVPPFEADSLKNFNIEEAVVVASPKETAQLRRQPVSVSLFANEGLKNRNIKSVNDLAAYAPNFFMPDYGSRITSACYIRGIGSRINTPAVGLYVDNVPFTDKSAYHFDFQDVVRVDVLRGPQGTLYGRNTMGGLIRVFTADPITQSGTMLHAGWTSRTGGRRFSGTTFLHPADRMGLSLSAYYSAANGFVRNTATGTKQDGESSAGGRLKWSWRPTDVVKLDWTASYEYSDEDANPYYLLGKTDQKGNFTPTEHPQVAQNRPGSYRRHLLNTGLGVEHRLPRVVLSSITAYQHLDDRLFMDQDFTAADVFSLEQKQYMHTLTEEIALKSPANARRWQWTTGVFGMYQYLRTRCPVTFYADGIDYLNKQLAAVMPQRPAISLGFTGKTLPFNARLVTPSGNVALFHQSVINDLGLKGLSLTLGLRLDYDYRELRLNAATDAPIDYHFGMQMGPAMKFDTDLQANPAMTQKLCNDSWQVLPKAALNYDLGRGLGNVYFSVAKGYRSGGYNIQAYSDLSQSLLQREMMLGVKDYSIATINRLPLPDAMKEKAIKGMTGILDKYTPAQPDAETLYYKPEYTWSYEVGTHLNLWDKALQLDLSAFYMKTRDQQLARFAESGMGRVMVNAGRSRSCGFEASVRTSLLAERLLLSAAYGYTNAVFTNYNLGSQHGETVDYTDNRVPFVPEHTFSVTADFRQPLQHAVFKAVSVGADVRGAGNVMWNEANTFSQHAYANLAARVGLELAGNLSIEAWGRNLTAARYATFSFDSMHNRFAQYNQPRHFGVDLRWKF